MRQIYLIKHASPQTQSGVPSDRWVLSEAGKQAAGVLADRLKDANLAAIVSSDEPKAAETAQILASRLLPNAKVEQYKLLREHDRRTVPMLRTPEFISLMAQVFKRPDELILGDETASEALERFQDGLDNVLAKHPEGNLAIVAHGTVIALYVASISKEDGYQLWRRMGLPSYVVIESPADKVVEIVAAVK
jgi:broad specificity phosphatase PhoE